VGVLRPCLSSDDGMDLRGLLRSGASDGTLRDAVTELVALKPPFHNFSEIYGRARTGHPSNMHCIGG
jgi:molybdenum cofactor biosynthesis enzyme MoaA